MKESFWGTIWGAIVGWIIIILILAFLSAIIEWSYIDNSDMMNQSRSSNCGEEIFENKENV